MNLVIIVVCLVGFFERGIIGDARWGWACFVKKFVGSVLIVVVSFFVAGSAHVSSRTLCGPR